MGDQGAELDAPAPDGLIRNVHATFQHHLLDLAQAQVEQDVEQDNMSDDLRRKAVALVADFCVCVDAAYAQINELATSGQLT